MKIALRFVDRNVPFKRTGRDIQVSLLRIMRGIDTDSVQGLVAGLDEWLASQIEISDYIGDPKIQEMAYDIFESFTVIIKASKSLTVKGVEMFIDFLFSQDRGVSLSTVHRAKGLEASRVFVVDKELFKEGLEEDNPRYVAYTRARNSLFFVPSDGVL